ncbi:sigma-70 family RNA polymerase sigma factor [Nocardioides endophyticus]|uniref:sigma-70 family RNA polymerase sigma factor n=1 Tax=Nocardioides endophyticus TaxID=1353775 RepID=UPI0031F04E5F
MKLFDTRAKSRNTGGAPSRADITAAAGDHGLTAEQELIARARSGDHDAVATLYREHRPLAMRIAHGLCRPADVEDVVAEAFTKVLDQIDRGAGPQVSFRAYLITAVRSAAADVGRRSARLDWSIDIEQATSGDRSSPQEPPGGDILAESTVLVQAVSSLPSRWQLVIWWTVVERRSLAEVGDALGINANAAAALAFRARGGLRDAYLALHLPTSPDEQCTELRLSLPALLRSRLTAGRSAAVEDHLRGCTPCSDAVVELRAVRDREFTTV